ncbi:MAG: hypothetical protein ACR2K1_07550 [Saprospiraceae bacterium]
MNTQQQKLEAGDKVVLTIPFFGAKMQFNGTVINTKQNVYSIEYTANGTKSITDAPADWVTKK